MYVRIVPEYISMSSMGVVSEHVYKCHIIYELEWYMIVHAVNMQPISYPFGNPSMPWHQSSGEWSLQTLILLKYINGGILLKFLYLLYMLIHIYFGGT